MTDKEAIERMERLAKGGTNFSEESNMACAIALAALREKRAAQQNDPLTLEELRGMAMDGGMAWCVDTDGVHPGLLCFVECVLDDKKEAHIWLLDEEGHAGRYNVRCMLECGAKFYRRPPEQ